MQGRGLGEVLPGGHEKSLIHQMFVLAKNYMCELNSNAPIVITSISPLKSISERPTAGDGTTGLLLISSICQCYLVMQI